MLSRLLTIRAFWIYHDLDENLHRHDDEEELIWKESAEYLIPFNLIFRLFWSNL